MSGEDIKRDRMLRYYASRYDEAGRLERGMGQLERVRTREILARHLPPPPATLLDVGAGPGAYAVPLIEGGYRVHVVDLVPRHVEQAQARARAAGVVFESARVGDARALPLPDDVADAVLLLGPMYHLQDEGDRVAALREAGRVARRGALIFAAGISRYASALDGMVRELLADPDFVAIVDSDLRSGRHDNPGESPDYFTTAYFHEPGQLEDEARAAGLEPLSTLAVEGPASLLSDVDERMATPARRALLLGALRRLEASPALAGVSWHHITLARA